MSTMYCNPVYAGPFADPFVLRVGDGYLAYGTGSRYGDRVFEVLESSDLVSWRHVGGALCALPDRTGTDYWAPEVIRDGTRWLMYYSVGYGDAAHHLRVAVAHDPRGPFLDQGVRLTPGERFAIDPHPFRDDDGTVYLFYARDVLHGPRVGTMLAVDVLDEPARLRGQPRTVLAPSGDWQIFQRQRAMYGRLYDWHTLEGPFVRRRNGRYFCFYSGGSWQGPAYAMAYAVADHPLGPWQEPPGTPPLLVTVPERVVGPGHVSVTSTPDGHDMLVYHAWDADLSARRMCIDPLVWTEHGPHVAGPTWTSQPLPHTGDR